MNNLFDLVIPKVGETVLKGTLMWSVKPGEYVVVDQTIAEFECQKATVEIAADRNGVISQNVANGSEVSVGQVIGSITENIDDPPISDNTQGLNPIEEVLHSLFGLTSPLPYVLWFGGYFIWLFAHEKSEVFSRFSLTDMMFGPFLIFPIIYFIFDFLKRAIDVPAFSRLKISSLLQGIICAAFFAKIYLHSAHLEDTWPKAYLLISILSVPADVFMLILVLMVPVTILYLFFDFLKRNANKQSIIRALKAFPGVLALTIFGFIVFFLVLFIPEFLGRFFEIDWLRTTR